MVDIEELRKRVAENLGIEEGSLQWSEQCRNPETNFHHEDGTIKGNQGYWVLRL